ncbi:MAG: nitrilase-related carbon-nitrogen hydrolase, partial [Woeseiaceae bacterium]
MSATSDKTTIRVGLAQIAPVWLNRKATLEKVIAWVEKAASEDCALAAFGEALVPGYPFWVERTDGAKFESDLQKSLYAHYVGQAVCIEDGDLEDVCRVAGDNRLSIYLGIMERAANRGGHSLYCSMVYIDQEGTIGSVHRKLMPTHEERLVWAIGDGNGLRTHKLG